MPRPATGRNRHVGEWADPAEMADSPEIAIESAEPSADKSGRRLRTA